MYITRKPRAYSFLQCNGMLSLTNFFDSFDCQNMSEWLGDITLVIGLSSKSLLITEHD